ncbi:hypothetical protein Tco_1344290 [Tanacetum coccineum]
MLAICNANEPVAFEAPNTSSYNRKKDSKGKDPGAITGHRRKQTSSTTKHNPGSKIEVTKGGSSSKETTGSLTVHSKIKKKSSSAKDSNPTLPSAFNPMVVELHKEDLVKSTTIHTKPIYLASTIIHSESASRHDASAASTAEADPGISALNDSVSKQQGIVKGTKNISFDHIIACTNPHVLVDKTKYASERLETILTKPETGKGASYVEKEISFAEEEFNTSPDLSSSDDAKKEIKLEDLSKLVPNVEVDFMDLDSPEDDEPIIIQDDEEEEVHSEKDDAENNDAEKTLNQKLVKEKDAAETEVALLKAKPSFLNMEQLTELLVKSLKPELSKLLSSHDFSNSSPTELKEIPSKFKDITWEIKELKKYVEKLEIELPRDLKEIPTKLEKFSSNISSLTTQVTKLKTLQWELLAEFITIPGQVSSIQAKIKTLDALPRLLTKVTEALDKFTQAIEVASQKAGDKGFLQQVKLALILLRGRRTQHKSQSLIHRGLIKKKGKEAISHQESKQEESKTNSEPIVKLTSSMVESFKKKKLKKFDFVTEGGDHIHLRKEQIKEQKRIKESFKVDISKQEVELRKEELIDLLGIDVSRITNCDVLTRKGPITLKAYPKRTGVGWTTIYEQIQTRMDYLYKTKQELGIDFNKPLGEQDPPDRLNYLARKKRKHADDIHDYFRYTKRFKSSVQYEDHPVGIVLNEPCMGMIVFNSFQRQDFVTIEDFGDFTNEMLYIIQEIFFKLHQEPGLDDHARTFSSFLLVEVDKRKPNPLKQMRVIEQLRHQM